jgi:sulfur carrier protein ThiS
MRNIRLQIESIETSSVLTKVTVESETTVADLLTKLKISSGKYLAILVDGKKAPLDQEIHAGQKVIILPMIAGG